VTGVINTGREIAGAGIQKCRPCFDMRAAHAWTILRHTDDIKNPSLLGRPAAHGSVVDEKPASCFRFRKLRGQ
jgi:hypothetical protein